MYLARYEIQVLSDANTPSPGRRLLTHSLIDPLQLPPAANRFGIRLDCIGIDSSGLLLLLQVSQSVVRSRLGKARNLSFWRFTVCYWRFFFLFPKLCCFCLDKMTLFELVSTNMYIFTARAVSSHYTGKKMSVFQTFFFLLEPLYRA